MSKSVITGRCYGVGGIEVLDMDHESVWAFGMVGGIDSMVAVDVLRGFRVGGRWGVPSVRGPGAHR